ncbi:MAG TPA: DUF4358 domain-containing protein [Lachnospiraceae bacterium]|nr:DUF4358 domain-containing protein [Lachnospiraceae bacterium]
MSKKIRMVAILLIVVVSMSACKKSKEPNVSVQELIDSVAKQIAKDNNNADASSLDWNRIDLSKEEGASLLEVMKMESKWVEEGIYFENASNESSDRIILIKVKDDKDMSKVKKALEETKKSQESDWKEMKKEQYEKVKNGTIAIQGKYIMYIVYEDVSGIKKIVDDKLLEK